MGNDSDLLFKALAALETEQEYAALLEDLLTPKELAHIADRLRVLLLLRSGMKQREVSTFTGVSVATVSSANRIIKNGAKGVALLAQRLQESGFS